MKKTLALATLVLVAGGATGVARNIGRPVSDSQHLSVTTFAPDAQKAKEKKKTKETNKPSKEQIMKVQKILQRYDYYEGPIDGVMNDDLRLAIEDFQEDEGLDVTGELDKETLKRILSLQEEEPETEPSKEPPSRSSMVT